MVDKGLSAGGNLAEGIEEQVVLRGLKEPNGIVEKMLSKGVTFQDVSSRSLGLESLNAIYNPKGCERREAVIPELYDLLETAREDQQLVVQGSPIGRDMDAFGNSCVRLSRLEQIQRFLSRDI